VRLEDRIACIAVPVPTPDFELSTSATGNCSPILIFEGVPLHEGLPAFFFSFLVVDYPIITGLSGW